MNTYDLQFTACKCLTKGQEKIDEKVHVVVVVHCMYQAKITALREDIQGPHISHSSSFSIIQDGLNCLNFLIPVSVKFVKCAMILEIRGSDANVSNMWSVTTHPLMSMTFNVGESRKYPKLMSIDSE